MLIEFVIPTLLFETSQVVLMVKNLPANAGDIRDAGSIPGWESSPGEEHGNPFIYVLYPLKQLYTYCFGQFLNNLREDSGIDRQLYHLV